MRHDSLESRNVDNKLIKKLENGAHESQCPGSRPPRIDGAQAESPPSCPPLGESPSFLHPLREALRIHPQEVAPVRLRLKGRSAIERRSVDSDIKTTNRCRRCPVHLVLHIPFMGTAWSRGESSRPRCFQGDQSQLCTWKTGVRLALTRSLEAKIKCRSGVQGLGFGWTTE